MEPPLLAPHPHWMLAFHLPLFSIFEPISSLIAIAHLLSSNCPHTIAKSPIFSGKSNHLLCTTILFVWCSFAGILHTRNCQNVSMVSPYDGRDPGSTSSMNQRQGWTLHIARRNYSMNSSAISNGFFIQIRFRWKRITLAEDTVATYWLIKDVLY